MKNYKKSLIAETFKVAWPAVVESVLISLAGMVDTYMVSGLGKAAVSAVGVTNQPKFFIYAFFFAVNTAVASLMARRRGENRKKDAEGLMVTALWLTVISGIVACILCVILSRPFMHLAGAKPETIDAATIYFQIVMGGSIFNFISMVINSAQRGTGNTKIAMTTNIVSNVVNVCCDYLFIEGHLGCPALGINGAALATVLGTVVAMIMSIASLNKKNSYIQLKVILKEKIKPSKEYFKQLAPLSTTILGENIFMRIGFLITGSLTARIGVEPFAAHLVGMNLMNLAFAFGDGLRSAMVALVGRSLGEKNTKKASDYTKTGLIFALVLSVGCSLLLIIFGVDFFNLYYPGDKVMLDYGSMICKFITIIFPVQVAKIVFNGTLQGAGDVKYTLIGSTIGVTVIQPILQAILIHSMDAKLTAVWITILVSQAVQLVLFFARYVSGKWKEKKI